MQLCCLVEDSAAKLNQIRIFFFSEMLNRFSFEVKLGRSSVLPYIVFLLLEFSAANLTRMVQFRGQIRALERAKTGNFPPHPCLVVS